MGVNAEKTKKNRFSRVTLWVRRQTAKLASGSAPLCGDTIPHTFVKIFAQPSGRGNTYMCAPVSAYVRAYVRTYVTLLRRK